MKENDLSSKQALFTIGIVAELVGVTPTTLRIWEKKGLIKPKRRGNNRYYSCRDLERLKEIRHLLQRKRMNIAGVKNLLALKRCWEIKECGPERDSCPVYQARQKFMK